MNERLEVGSVVVETTPSGREVEHVVVGFDRPPRNPAAHPGPYIELTDPMRGEPLFLREDHIRDASWLTVREPVGGKREHG